MKTALLAFAACVAFGPTARAGEAACWYENGVVVVTAEVAGVVGDYILDTGQAQTQLAETQAQGAGYEATALSGAVKLAGVTVPGQSIAVADIDVRTGLHPIPIAGIIGADALNDLVLDVSFAPCGIGVWPRGRAPRLRGYSLPLEPAGRLLALQATVSDGAEARKVRLVPSTGSDVPLRLSDAFASASGGDKPQELYPYGVLRPKLRALAFGGELWEEVPGGLLKAAAGVDGWIGPPVLDRFKVRFDFPRRRLTLGPK